MSNLSFEKKVFPSAHFGGWSDMPSMVCNGGGLIPTDLDEDDGLFINYGNVREILPYRQQDQYDRALVPTEYTVAVLENEYLRATFTPCFGGKLWSLWDKEYNRDLLNVNPVVRPCNLALLNAWMSGGVEWNIGVTGHSPFTCSQLFTARLTGSDGEPILRFYEYERRRGSVYQMDFTLPSGSRFLYARMRIVNPHETVIPMYWWSTVAVDEAPGSRVIVPADDTYITGGGYPKVCKRPIPCAEDKDVTYGVNSRNSIDYFFHIANERRYMTQVDRGGFGLVQTSTSRQRGRKLFVWGQGNGGQRWQKYLTENGRPYVEIQAGLASTQLESLPMPARTAWEWMEAYGPISAEPSSVHGDWQTAKKTVEDYLDAACPQSMLETRLRETRADALRPADEVLFAGSGWGALEKLRRAHMGERPLPEHLDFGKPGAEQQMWVELIENGRLPELDAAQPLPSYMIQDGYMQLLRKQTPDFASELMLGLSEYAKNDYSRAEEHFARSLALGYSCAGLYAMANVCRAQSFALEGAAAESKRARAADYMTAAIRLSPDDVSLARDAMRFVMQAGRFADAVRLYETLPEQVRAHGNMRLMYARSLAETGRCGEAHDILYENGGLEIPDLREGENSITDLWFFLERKKAEREGRPFDEKSLTPPDFANFRMQIE